MADQQVGNVFGVAASHIGGAGSRTNLSGTANAPDGWELDTLDSITAMRTRLNAISATLYTAVNMDKMTYNDMVYAIRLADAPATIR